MHIHRQRSSQDRICGTDIQQSVNMAYEGSTGPLLTLEVSEVLRAAVRAGRPKIECTLDLGCSTTMVEVSAAGWSWQGQRFPHLESCKVRTVYYWIDEAFQPVVRYTTSLVKLVPTAYGPPTFEIDGIKMLPTARVSPYSDAERKVDLIQPKGKVILDTCGGLGYFAGWCMRRHAKQVLSYEKNPDVIWLRSLNPWSPKIGNGLTLAQADIAEAIELLPGRSMPSCMTRPVSASRENSTRKPFTGTSAGCSSRMAGCFITPARQTNSPADATCPAKWPNAYAAPGL